MRITRIQATDFRCIEQLDQAIGEGGAIVSGGNARGKTSVLLALHAAITGQGASPSAVRLGADRAVIEVDLDDVTVRRLIPREGRSTVSVRSADGMTRGKPQTWLDQLVGPTLDPLAIYLAPPKERRARILEALPITVTREQLTRWAPDLPAETSVEGHGLEVLARVRDWYYEKRTAANAADKAARAEATRLASDAAALPHTPMATTADDAESEIAKYRAAIERLIAQDEQSRRSIERTASTREKIAQAKHRAEELLSSEEVIAAARKASNAAAEKVKTLRAQLRQDVIDAEQLAAVETTCVRRNDEAYEYAKHAMQMEQLLAEAAVAPIDPEELAAYRESLEHEQENLALAKGNEKRADAIIRAETAKSMHAMAFAEAERLDTIVRALTDDAPRELLAAANGIPGLGLADDDITLDGVPIMSLCGAEQLDVAVQIAKRANARRELKLLVVDGLERLDAEQTERFVASATADGWQLLATRVTGGDVVVEAIEPERPAPSNGHALKLEEPAKAKRSARRAEAAK